MEYQWTHLWKLKTGCGREGGALAKHPSLGRVPMSASWESSGDKALVTFSLDVTQCP